MDSGLSVEFFENESENDKSSIPSIVYRIINHRFKWVYTGATSKTIEERISTHKHNEDVKDLLTEEDTIVLVYNKGLWEVAYQNNKNPVANANDLGERDAAVIIENLETYFIRESFDMVDVWKVLNQTFTGGFNGVFKGYWTEENCKEEALKYNTRSEFAEGSSAYDAARRNEWLDKICEHMIPGNLIWDFENCRNEALKYKTKSEFKKFSAGAYGAARKNNNNWLDDICEHMIEVIKPSNYWTKENCKEEALKYKTKGEFMKFSAGAYGAARSNEWLDDICEHMIEVKKPKGTWDNKDRCKEEALKYKTKNEFKEGNSSAYKAALRNGWGEICSHMIELTKPKSYWTKDKCKKEALKYKTKNEFQKGNSSAYSAAWKNEWLDDICEHMIEVKKPKGTWDNKDRCKEEALKYKTKSEFKKFSAGAYSAAYKNGWLDEFFPK